MSNKRTRRNLRRIAERKGIGYGEAIVRFYGKEISDIDKNLAYSLHKKTVLSRELRGRPVVVYNEPRHGGHIGPDGTPQGE